MPSTGGNRPAAAAINASCKGCIDPDTTVECHACRRRNRAAAVVSARWALIAVIALLHTACGSNDSAGVDPAVSGSPSDVAVVADTGADKLDRDSAIAAAIDVRSTGCGPRIGFGTGSVIGNGDVVTAAHVVAGSSSIELIDVAGAHSDAVVILFDPDLDLAVLRPSTPLGTPAVVRGRDATTGETGLVVLPRLVDGRMEVEVAEVSVVRTANIETTDIYLAKDVVRAGYEIVGSIDPGDSGAMVVLPGGAAGIVWARSSISARRAWAIDLPAGLRDGSALAGVRQSVDVGECTAPKPG